MTMPFKLQALNLASMILKANSLNKKAHLQVLLDSNNPMEMFIMAGLPFAITLW